MEWRKPRNDPSKHRLANSKECHETDRLGAASCPYPGAFSKDDSTIKYISEVAKSLLTSANAHGLIVSEFQLDFDCAQKKLSGYSLWVEAVRTAVDPPVL